MNKLLGSPRTPLLERICMENLIHVISSVVHTEHILFIPYFASDQSTYFLGGNIYRNIREIFCLQLTYFFRNHLIIFLAIALLIYTYYTFQNYATNVYVSHNGVYLILCLYIFVFRTLLHM